VLKNQKGFTLIELLIVIVIIGILAGVLIAIIDPNAQQNRARDAGVQASINKAALAAGGFVSAYGRTPEGDEFYNALSNVSESSLGACAAGGDTCTYSVNGNELGLLCDAAADDWDGSGALQCWYYYEGALGAGSDYRICARSYGINLGMFCFLSSDGYMSQCDEDGNNCVRL